MLLINLNSHSSSADSCSRHRYHGSRSVRTTYRHPSGRDRNRRCSSRRGHAYACRAGTSTRDSRPKYKPVHSAIWLSKRSAVARCSRIALTFAGNCRAVMIPAKPETCPGLSVARYWGSKLWIIIWAKI